MYLVLPCTMWMYRPPIFGKRIHSNFFFVWNALKNILLDGLESWTNSFVIENELLAKIQPIQYTIGLESIPVSGHNFEHWTGPYIFGMLRRSKRSPSTSCLTPSNRPPRHKDGGYFSPPEIHIPPVPEGILATCNVKNLVPFA